MIRQIRRLVVVLFILSVIFSTGTRLYYKKTTDSVAPVISMDQASIDLSIKDSTDVILDGITAEDDRDGDVTSGLTIESISNFISDSTREVTIAAFDQAGNVSKTKRTIHYTDYTSPKLNLKNTLCVSSTEYTSLLDLIRVTDSLDGDISGNVQLTSDNVSGLSDAGDYKMHIQVTNSAGDSLNIPVTVTINDNLSFGTRAEITLKKYVTYVKIGAHINPENYLKQLKYDAKVYTWDKNEQALVDKDVTTSPTGYEYHDKLRSGDYTIENNCDTSKEGTYEITYRYKKDNISGMARLLVIVGGEE